MEFDVYKCWYWVAEQPYKKSKTFKLSSSHTKLYLSSLHHWKLVSHVFIWFISALWLLFVGKMLSSESEYFRYSYLYKHTYTKKHTHVEYTVKKNIRRSCTRQYYSCIAVKTNMTMMIMMLIWRFRSLLIFILHFTYFRSLWPHNNALCTVVAHLRHTYINERFLVVNKSSIPPHNAPRTRERKWQNKKTPKNLKLSNYHEIDFSIVIWMPENFRTVYILPWFSVGNTNDTVFLDMDNNKNMLFVWHAL